MISQNLNFIVSVSFFQNDAQRPVSLAMFGKEKPRYSESLKDCRQTLALKLITKAQIAPN